MTSAHVIGFPRIGARRELKNALERYWKGALSEAGLKAVGVDLRARHWALQIEAGLDYLTVGDFAWYDHVHNVTCLFGAAPERFGLSGSVDLEGYFSMARGTADQPALAMKKWFDTNYHYLVPELGPTTRFALNPRWLLLEVKEALTRRRPVKVVLTGPLTWLWLASAQPGFDKLSLLPSLVKAYAELSTELKSLGVQWLQLDEPMLAQDVPAEWLAAFGLAYAEIAAVAPSIMLATYFGSVAEHASLLRSLPVGGLHLDLVRAPEQIDVFLPDWPRDKVLSLGVVDGRNVWRTDLARALSLLHTTRAAVGERLWISASCSLLHVPADLRLEQKLDPEIRAWMAFAVQKLDEIVLLKRALVEGESAVWRELHTSSTASEQRRKAAATHRQDVRVRVAALNNESARRRSPFAIRAQRQRQALNLPLLPTTTIGSFPQTTEIRQSRAAFKQGRLDEAQYESIMQSAIRDAVTRQEAIGLDVLVHGEPERNDMVEYFGEQLDGVAITEHGWVQSYGSRCVKPPIIYGDVTRPRPMTLDWARYAQSLTSKPMKGMLTGPVTMLFWSFVRDDLPRKDVALQLALALRDEVCDLEGAGLRIVQIDEPALREGLPLRRARWDEYLEWAVHAFRICSSGVRDETQIHTHMCYSQFNDILPSIAAMDADVITIETSRARMALLDAFAQFRYPASIGPGVYDIHSPRVPAAYEMRTLLKRALEVLPAERLWINPDCGLKTRDWAETEAALKQMVSTAQALRAELAGV
jgi:5-methyltetrahydropteroyltriglutamate--homocysteine methyltransferase